MSNTRRDTLLGELRKNVIEVVFDKVGDGSRRILRCTLRPEYLPKKYISEAEQEKQYHTSNPDNIAAWDVINGGWRSFRIDSVIYMQDVNEQYP